MSNTGTAAATAVGEAKVPLERVIEWVRASETAQGSQTTPPPLAASLQSIELEGSVLQDALDLGVHLEAVVLSDREWTRLELLKLGPGSHLAELPRVAGGMLALEGDTLVLITQQAKRYAIDLRLMQRAERKGELRTASIQVPGSAPAELRLRFAPELLRLEQAPVRQDAEGALFLPEQGRFEVAWQPLVEAVDTSAELAPPAAADPTIPKARASSVSTLEGARITRIAYDLSFSGPREIRFELPEGDRVQYAYLNGRSVPFQVEGSSLRLNVSPARSGGDRASLELVLAREVPNFLLSGTLNVRLPTPAWPVSELVLDVHLPDVFEYAWTGGSLSPAESGKLPTFVYEIPRPGKRLSFRQYLVRRAAPDVSLRYAVDLDGRYFR